jgi:hypothetical protein
MGYIQEKVHMYTHPPLKPPADDHIPSALREIQQLSYNLDSLAVNGQRLSAAGAVTH